VIEVTRWSGSTLVLNADAIERVEATPDTVITLFGGSTYVVRETVDEVVAAVVAYKSAVFAPIAPTGLVVLDGGEG